MKSFITIIIIPLAFLIVPIFYIWDAFFFIDLWTWFAVPLGAPILTIYQITGLLLLWGFLNYEKTRAKEAEEDHSGLVRRICNAPFCWAIGWLIHKWFIL